MCGIGIDQLIGEVCIGIKINIHQILFDSAGDADKGTQYPLTSLFWLWSSWVCLSGPIMNLRAII